MTDIPTITRFTFEQVDNFDMFNDLDLDPNDDILPNLTFAAMTPSMDTSIRPTVYKYWDCDFGVDSGDTLAIPLIWCTVTALNNLKHCDFLNSTLGNDYDIYVKNYYDDSYYYSDGYHNGEEYHQNMTKSVHGLIETNIPVSDPDSYADDCAYITDGNLTYSGFVPPFYINTNIPIILCDSLFDDDSSNARAYQRHEMTLADFISSDEHILGIINGPEEIEQPLVEYVCTAIANEYTFNEYGDKTPTASPTKYRAFKIRSKKKFSLYKIAEPENGNLYYGISFEDLPEAAYYSNDDPTFSTWMQVPGQPQTLPFNRIWRSWEGEVGTFYCVDSITGLDENIPEWENEDDANDYNSGEKDIEDANNWGDISGGYKPKNNTGEDNEETEFGEVYTRGFFSQQYILDSTALSYIANCLFDTASGGIFHDIKKGLEMYGENCIDAVMGLSFWPLPLANVISGTSPETYIFFGGYQLQNVPGLCRKIIYPNGYKSLGSITIRRSFNSWRDYSPYTRLYVSLPYVGVYELDLTRYYNKTVEVRYFFDTRTNGCIACLIADGHLMDYFNGQMGVTMPITLTDYAGYANSQIATLLGGGGMAAGAAGGITMGAVGVGKSAIELGKGAIGASGVPGAAMAAGAGATAAGAVGIVAAGAPIAGAAIGAKTVYGLATNALSKYNVTKGASSSMINEYLPQYVEFIFEIQKDCAPANYVAMYGKPSMKSGSISSFQGFLKCQSVKLDCGVATENEKNTIKTMLLNGIYI